MVGLDPGFAQHMLDVELEAIQVKLDRAPGVRFNQFRAAFSDCAQTASFMPLARQVSISCSARSMRMRWASFMRFLVVETNARAKSAAMSLGGWAPDAYIRRDNSQFLSPMSSTVEHWRWMLQLSSIKSRTTLELTNLPLQLAKRIGRNPARQGLYGVNALEC